MNIVDAAKMALAIIDHNDVPMNDAVHNALNDLRKAVADAEGMVSPDGSQLLDAITASFRRGFSEGADSIVKQSLTVVPEGMVLVPIEPTENQLFHGYKARAETRIDEVRSIYKAMLAAAQVRDVA